MADETKNDPAVGLGLLSVIGGLGGAMASGQMGEWEHTFCEDCSVHRPARTLGAGYVNCEPASVVWHEKELGRQPPWPGCRGFKLRVGAPGPAKRYHDTVKREHAEARAKAAEADKED